MNWSEVEPVLVATYPLLNDNEGDGSATPQAVCAALDRSAEDERTTQALGLLYGEDYIGRYRGQATRTEDRTAVPLTRYRRARAELLADLERLRSGRCKAQGSKKRRRYTTKLRPLLLVDLLGQVEGRPDEALALIVANVTDRHHFGHGVAGPAVFFTPFKKGSGTPVERTHLSGRSCR